MKRLHVKALLTVTIWLASALAAAAKPDVAPHSPDWTCAHESASYSAVQLANAGLIRLNSIDNSKTEIQVLSKTPGVKGSFAAIYRIVLHAKSGKSVAIITKTSMVDGECPGARMTTYVISQQFDD
ncbi:hypothetical protein AB7849_06780 [Rhodanobacter sp. 115]|uniref:hypothetical protein n=1 Tax=Rhodanobacter sp. FW021-MT20 TaxID=1162282 RepID=UPI000260F4AA|nr:hypothetical protein [Rhodanobacter sp. 115]EIL95946.1 hypothetical protein UU5_08850 [Rhodanobacter sp. 115]